MPDARAASRAAEVTDSAAPLDVIVRPLTIWERLSDSAFVRKTSIVAVLAAVWEIYARALNNPLMFPTLSATVRALAESIESGEVPGAAVYSLGLLLEGYAIGLVMAALLTALASATRLGADLLETLTSMFNPLPSVALLPMAILWFGFGRDGIAFVLIHAVLWAVALNTHAGFRAVSPTLRMVGQNYGLSGIGFVSRILIPAACPSILAGLKIGWAFAWRTLSAAELVFGGSGGQGGLGLFVFEYKNELRIPEVFAGLLTVILFGLFVDNVIFSTIESKTVRRWGMQT
jgi:NitT/TauT family transport system permease protein